MRQDRLFLLFLANVEIICKQNDNEFTLKRGNMSLEEAINVFNRFFLNKRATFTVKESDYDHYFNDPDYNNDYEDEYEYEYDYEED